MHTTTAPTFGPELPPTIEVEARASVLWREFAAVLAAAHGAVTGPAASAVTRAAARHHDAYRLACRCVARDIDTTTATAA